MNITANQQGQFYIIILLIIYIHISLCQIHNGWAFRHLYIPGPIFVKRLCYWSGPPVCMSVTKNGEHKDIVNEGRTINF